MNKLIRLYNQNRRKIWRFILIIVVFFIVLQVLNYYAGENNEKKFSNSNTSVIPKNENNNINTTSKVTSSTYAVSGNNIEKDKLKDVQNILDKFYGYCNSKDLHNAYNMLTDECKELLYPDINYFSLNYYNNIFEGKSKIYTFKNWTGNTYIVTVEENSLSTGIVSNDLEKKIDYVTVVGEKLNISTYIGRTQINKEATERDINIIVNYKDSFMDYESYNITVKNNSKKIINLVSNLESVNSVYLVDKNNIKYGFYNYELNQDNMVFKSGFSKNIKLKFYSGYVSTKKIEKLVFDEILINTNSKEDDDIEESEILRFVIDLK